MSRIPARRSSSLITNGFIQQLTHQLALLQPQLEALNKKETERKRPARRTASHAQAISGLGSAQLRSVQRRLAQECVHPTSFSNMAVWTYSPFQDKNTGRSKRAGRTTDKMARESSGRTSRRGLRTVSSISSRRFALSALSASFNVPAPRYRDMYINGCNTIQYYTICSSSLAYSSAATIIFCFGIATFSSPFRAKWIVWFTKSISHCL